MRFLILTHACASPINHNCCHIIIFFIRMMRLADYKELSIKYKLLIIVSNVSKSDSHDAITVGHYRHDT